MPICSLCGNLLFMMIMLAITSLYFVISGLQFWGTAYLVTVIAAPQNEVFTFYTLMCLISPTLGFSLSIILFNCIGGYGSRGALGLCLLISALGLLFSIAMPRANLQSIVFCLLSLVYFFNSLVMAPLTGVMLQTVPLEGRAAANSLANLCYNVLGYGLAPLLFGVVADSHQDGEAANPIESMRFAMKILMIWSLFVFGFLMIATLVKLKRDAIEGDDYLKLGVAGNDENLNQINRGIKSNHLPKELQVLQPEDALSSHIGCES